MKKSSSGFTLIELVVTLGVFIVLGGVVLINLSGRRTTVDLTNTSEDIAATLRQAQSNAMAQKGNTTWSVRFTSGATSSFALFSGSYATGTIVGQYPLLNDIHFDTSSIASGTYIDVIFAPVTGIPFASTSIMLDLMSGVSSVSASTTVSVSSVGLISN